jgi:hypothetical protein
LLFRLILNISQTHYFTSNTIEDLVCRVAAVRCGVVPVTVNWQVSYHTFSSLCKFL